MKNHNILFNSWAAAFFQKGGGEYQLLHTKSALEELGHPVNLYNPWAPQTDFEIFHQFSIEMGVEKVVEQYRRLGKKIALSTIMWSFVPKTHPEFTRIKKIFLNSDVFLTNSDMESKRLSEFFELPIDKFFKTRNSITDFFQKQASEELFKEKFNIEGPFVLSVANIDTRKNTELLVKACQELNMPLITIGHVKDHVYFDRFKSIFSSYRHVGSIEDIELLKSAYAACDLFALPSICETPSIAALEAASQGAKIVITQEGSTSEYFKSHATYVDPLSLASITSGIESELKNKRDDSLKKYVLSEYTWKKTALDVITAYESIGGNIV